MLLRATLLCAVLGAMCFLPSASADPIGDLVWGTDAILDHYYDNAETVPRAAGEFATARLGTLEGWNGPILQDADATVGPYVVRIAGHIVVTTWLNAPIGDYPVAGLAYSIITDLPTLPEASADFGGLAERSLDRTATFASGNAAATTDFAGTLPALVTE